MIPMNQSGYAPEPESPTEDANEPGEEESTSAMSPEEIAQRGHKAKGKTHRGRRSKGKGAKAHHDAAKEHLAAAQSAPTPQAAHAHLFRALSSLKKAM